jgi:hypothetical protein
MSKKSKKKGRFVGFEIDTRNGAIKTHSFTGIKRENKPGFKVITKFTDTNISGLSANASPFTHLFAIDTNSIVSKKRSLSCGIACEIHEDTLHFVKCFPDYTKIENAEKTNWIRFIKDIQLKPTYSSKHYFGIIVDSDLGHLSEINKREVPILDNFYLPQNIQLIYASADKKNDTFLNEAISFCDKIAKQVLDALLNMNLSEGLKVVKVANCFKKPPLQ